MKNRLWGLLTSPLRPLTVAVLGIAFLLPVVTAAASYFYVATNGDMGIGTDSPLAPLDVAGAIYSRLVTDSDAASTTVDWHSGNVHKITLNTIDQCSRKRVGFMAMRTAG